MPEVWCASNEWMMGTRITSMKLPLRSSRWKSYCDDLIGRELKKDLVEAAKAEELSVVKKMQVWRKVRRE